MNSTEVCNIPELIDQIKEIKSRVSFYKDKLNYLISDIKVINEDLLTLNDRLKIIENAKQYYLRFIDRVYLHSIEEMENFVNYVLAYVFYDESYKIKLDISNKRNKSMTFYVIDENRKTELPLRKGNGKGVQAIVSFILLTYYLLRMKTPYIFLDESFVNISAGYVERFFDYIRKLCNDHKLCIVLITHDTRFPEFANKIYNVKKGVITCVYDDSKV